MVLILLLSVKFASYKKRLQKLGAGYTFFWSGKPQKKSVFLVLVSCSELLSHRSCKIYYLLLLTVSCLKKKKYAMLRLFKLNLEKKTIFNQKSVAFFKEPLLTTSYFNAREDQNTAAWKGVLGRHDVISCNNNKQLTTSCLPSKLQQKRVAEKNSEPSRGVFRRDLRIFESISTHSDCAKKSATNSPFFNTGAVLSVLHLRSFLLRVATLKTTPGHFELAVPC